MYVSQKVLMMEGTTPVAICLMVRASQSLLLHHQSLQCRRRQGVCVCVCVAG